MIIGTLDSGKEMWMILSADSMAKAKDPFQFMRRKNLPASGGLIGREKGHLKVEGVVARTAGVK